MFVVPYIGTWIETKTPVILTFKKKQSYLI